MYCFLKHFPPQAVKSDEKQNSDEKQKSGRKKNAIFIIALKPL